tara:strand:+ start:5845 stop:6345 length:501 start_codon:yes stop_codon:yes gene_type:complete
MALSKILSGSLASGVGGKILQVVQTSKTDTFSTTSTSFTDVTGLSVAITPSSTSSKVLVIVSCNSSTSGGNNGMIKLVRGSTDISVGDASSSRVRATAQYRINDTNGAGDLTFSFLDTPSTTSATTYKAQYRVQAGTGNINSTNADTDSGQIARTASSIIAMEVSA